ncbi:nuclear transport factor 2 family protein [Arthrobacter bambusae]|uniref:nuclear transport factor 2 family protein n=1 Tax=Arthrobacter bambusae TaxID=1338426 RepID=UPI00277D2BE4|nr:nuclear transport factor 2 family protein [Arthrobacter bambusae]MDQ0212987.1 hypothetical protein [Arthrobacter bambusae]MDQ0237293.1 hypothetical protein [Arthrobacter bambusae]
MEIASQEVIRVASDWIMAGHARNGPLLASLSEELDPLSVFTFASASNSNLTLQELLGHLTDVIPCPVTESKPSGFQEGDLAWVVDNPNVDIPAAGKTSIRITVVLHRSGGEWRVVHGHLSEGVDHAEANLA